MDGCALRDREGVAGDRVDPVASSDLRAPEASPAHMVAIHTGVGGHTTSAESSVSTHADLCPSEAEDTAASAKQLRFSEAGQQAFLSHVGTSSVTSLCLLFPQYL
jgi:hypothetical protein